MEDTGSADGSARATTGRTHVIRTILYAVTAALLILSPMRAAMAQSTPEAAAMAQSTLYFGLRSPAGGVSEQQWTRFLAEQVTPRFPDGLTVLNAYGQSGTNAGDAGSVLREQTKVLIIVHPDTAEARETLAGLKEIYKERFPEAAVFHTRSAVEIVTE